ncbi:sialin-like [Saccoglossus kowalevskii]|uniref:Sialin-like n=1 Tax=Saccoglossus kowalevskii TaxID=10224 RepID=A0ABM0MAD4_SACKO|nr:PREDICTED: sialin-like [Saccoglossus kowalevskii]
MNPRLFKRNKFSDLIAARHVLAIWLFFGMLNAYTMRTNLSVAIVAMVNSTGQDSDAQASADECGINATDTEEEETGDFNWSSYQQGVLLGAFYYGYTIMQIPGGWLERKFGAMRVYGGSILLCAILTMLTPAAAWLGFGAIFTCRFLLGFCQVYIKGPIFPSSYGMWGKWAPPLERSRLISFSQSGVNWGSIVAMSLSGVLSVALGWESCFYVFGIISLFWCVFWFFLIWDIPDSHPRISEEERSYIVNSITTNVKKSGWRVPWLSIFKSPQVWGLTIGHFCSSWGSYTLLTSLPQYMDQILGFNLGANGFMSSLSSLAIWTFKVFYAWLADYTRQRYIMSTIQVRRVLTSLGMFLPAVFLMMGGQMGCNRGLAVLFITISSGFSGCNTPGFKVNHVEIAPKFGGILFGIANTAGSIAGSLSPLVVGAATAEENTREQWQKIFGLSALIYVIGGIAVLLTLRVDEREWAKDKEARQKDNTQQTDIMVFDNVGFEKTESGSEDDIYKHQKHE